MTANDKKMWQFITIVVGATLVLSMAGYITLPNIFNPTIPATVTPTTPTTTPTTPATSPTETIYEAAALKWAVQNAITGATVSSSSTSYLDVARLVDGVWDPIKGTESVEFASDPETSVLEYTYGDQLIFRCTGDNDFTNGAEEYSRWFYTTLKVGEPIRELVPSVLSVVQTSPQYLYRLSGVGPDTGWEVSYVAGTTPYWGLGAFQLYPRIAAANLDVIISYAGTTLTTVTDASSWDDTQGEQNSDATLTSDTENMYVKLLAEQNDLSYGLPQYYLSQKGEFQEYRAVIVLATNATSIGVNALTADGWAIADKPDLTANVAFFKVIDELIPNRGTKFDQDYEVSIDASSLTGSTAYFWMGWVLDHQLPSNVAAGSTTTSLPTVYGMEYEASADAVILARALTVSSGAAATPQVFCDWTTAS